MYLAGTLVKKEQIYQTAGTYICEVKFCEPLLNVSQSDSYKIMHLVMYIAI